MDRDNSYSIHDVSSLENQMQNGMELFTSHQFCGIINTNFVIAEINIHTLICLCPTLYSLRNALVHVSQFMLDYLVMISTLVIIFNIS